MISTKPGLPTSSAATSSPNAAPAAAGQSAPVLVPVRCVYGVTHYVRQQDLQNEGRTMLRRYNKAGTLIEGEGKTHLHRGNLDPDGSRTKEAWKDVPYFTAKNDRPFATTAAAVAAVKRYGQDPADFALEPVTRGTVVAGYIPVRKSLLQQSHLEQSPSGAPGADAASQALTDEDDEEAAEAPRC